MTTEDAQMVPAPLGPVERLLGPTPLPAPAGFRTRYRSEPGMIGHYPWTYADAGRRKGSRPECEYEDLFTADQMRAAVAAERERLEEALRKTWRMVDPLRPAGTPGSYARGQDSGIVAALKTLRQNLGPNERLTGAQRPERQDDEQH